MEGDLLTAQCCRNPEHFNPLPPHGGRPADIYGGKVTQMIFQSTPSAWRETLWSRRKSQQTFISIHSLRMEGDKWQIQSISHGSHFNPLPPHGGRRVATCKAFDLHDQFQSTPSAWRETKSSAAYAGVRKISIHSLRMEGDLRVR